MRVEPKTGPKWLKATERRQELLLLTDFTLWTSHFDTTEMKSRRCGGADCLLCSMGMQKINRWIVLGLDSFGQERLFELRERHRDSMQRIYDESGSAVGVRLSIVKKGAHANAPVDVTILAKETAFGRNITNLVASLGLPARRVRETSKVDAERSDDFDPV